jgi:hypothetical protein
VAGPNTYKIVWSFVGPLGSTWNEVYYTNASNPAQAISIGTGAADSRLWLLHKTCTWQSISASDVANPRSTATRRTNFQGAYPGPDPGLPDLGSPAETSLVAQLVGTNGGSRKIWMRGIPAALVGTNPNTGVSLFGPATRQYFSSYISGIAAQGYGVRTLTATPRYQISAIANGPAPGTTTLTYTVPAGQNPPMFIAGSQVSVRQADQKQFPSLLGYFTVLNTGPSSITVRYTLPNAMPPSAGLGYLRQVVYNNVSVFDPARCIPAYWGSHDTRVFTQRSRGARRARRIRSLA